MLHVLTYYIIHIYAYNICANPFHYSSLLFNCNKHVTIKIFTEKPIIFKLIIILLQIQTMNTPRLCILWWWCCNIFSKKNIKHCPWHCWTVLRLVTKKNVHKYVLPSELEGNKLKFKSTSILKKQNYIRNRIILTTKFHYTSIYAHLHSFITFTVILLWEKRKNKKNIVQAI